MSPGCCKPQRNHRSLPLKLIVQYTLIKLPYLNLNKKFKKIHIPSKLCLKFAVFIFGGRVHKFVLIFKCSFLLRR